jgi:uncharacterized protein (TIGR03437 family)
MKLAHLLGAMTLLVAPTLLFARSAGAPINRTGAPSDGGQDCTACHRSNVPANVDSRGSISISAVNYTPGQRQTLRVTVFHPEASRWGFSFTSRLASMETRKAGVVTPNADVQVLCDPSGNAPCGTDREFATHVAASTTKGANGSATFSFEWTAPEAGSGDVVFYAAANAANGGGTNAGDYIYATKLTIQQAGAQQRPALTSESAIAAGGFGGGRTVAPGTWIEIYGTTLSNVTREWAGFDFNGSNAPTTLEGVRVSVGGRDAFVRLVSPGQVNAQVPDGIGTGPVNVTVTNSAGTSTNAMVTGAARAPQVLAPPNFRVNGRQLVAALFTDNTTFVGRAGEVAGVTTRPARVGETIVIYAIGCGAVTPATAAGVIAGSGTALPDPRVFFGDAPATVTFAGLSPGSIGLYQFNVTVPNVGAGDQRLRLLVDGFAAPQEVFTVVGQ